MHAVAEFVRERHDVARLAEIIDQHVRVRRRRRRMREGAGALPGRTGASIQPSSKNRRAMSAMRGEKPR